MIGSDPLASFAGIVVGVISRVGRNCGIGSATGPPDWIVKTGRCTSTLGKRDGTPVPRRSLLKDGSVVNGAVLSVDSWASAVLLMLSARATTTNQAKTKRNIGETPCRIAECISIAGPSQRQILDSSKTYHATVPQAARRGGVFVRNCRDTSKDNDCAENVFRTPQWRLTVVAISPQVGVLCAANQKFRRREWAVLTSFSSVCNSDFCRPR